MKEGRGPNLVFVFQAAWLVGLKVSRQERGTRPPRPPPPPSFFDVLCRPVRFLPNFCNEHSAKIHKSYFTSVQWYTERISLNKLAIFCPLVIERPTLFSSFSLSLLESFSSSFFSVDPGWPSSSSFAWYPPASITGVRTGGRLRRRNGAKQECLPSAILPRKSPSPSISPTFARLFRAQRWLDRNIIIKYNNKKREIAGSCISPPTKKGVFFNNEQRPPS